MNNRSSKQSPSETNAHKRNKRVARGAKSEQRLQRALHIESFEETNELAFVSERSSGKTLRIIQIRHD